MKSKNIIILAAMAFLFSGILPLSSFGQQKGEVKFNTHASLLSPEKVYLHTDRDVYNASDTIWISGYVENATYNSEFPESNYIYVELIKSQLQVKFASWSYRPYYEPSVIKRIKIRRHNGGFSGYIAIPDEETSGKCIIRGYTYWMLNRPADYMFYKEITITNPYNDDLLAKMKEKNITEISRYSSLNAVAPIDNREDSTRIRADYDVQFLPEGGHLISGVQNTVWIKSLNNMGYGSTVYGEIRGEDGEGLTTFATDSMGFAKIILPAIVPQELVAHITDSADFSKTFALPPFEQEGVALRGSIMVEGEEEYSAADRCMFSVSATQGALRQGLMAMVHNGSQILLTRRIESPASTFFIRYSSLQPGIHTLTIVDTLNNVYAERPFMVLPVTDNSIEIYPNKTTYGAWEKVTCKVRIPDFAYDTLDKTHIPHLSVAVTDMGMVGDLDGESMESYFLLKSELKGYIERPGYYFNREIPLKQRMARVDMLMQTQGWRYYETPEILKGTLGEYVYGREYAQTLSGEVRGLFKVAKSTTVSFVAPSIGFTAIGQVDSGYFVLKDISFPENTKFLVSAIGKNGRKGTLTPTLFPDYFAPVFQYPLREERFHYNRQYKSNIVDNLYGDGYAMSLELDPVVVTSTYITLKNSPSPLPNLAIKRDRIRDEKAIAPYAKSYDIASYVISQYPSVRLASDGSGLRGRFIGASGGMQAGARWTPIKFFLNGMKASWSDIEFIPLEDVENLAYLEGLDASTHTGDGETSPIPVLMVRTKKDLHLRQPTNVSSGTPIGWQRPKRFYSPNYEVAHPENDYRVTLYWNPNLKVNRFGYGQFTFWTKQKQSSYRIEIEGIKGYRQYLYGEEVIHREQE